MPGVPSASLTFRVGDRELTDPGEVSAAVAGWKAGLSEGKFAHKDGKDGRFHTVVCSGCSKSGHLKKMGRTKLPGGRESHGFMCKSCGATTTVINSPGETVKAGGSETNNPPQKLVEAETRADHPEHCSLPHGKMAKRGKRICPGCKAPLKVEEASASCPSCGMPNTARTGGSRVGKCKHCGINYSSVVHKATIAESLFDKAKHPRSRGGKFAPLDGVTAGRVMMDIEGAGGHMWLDDILDRHGHRGVKKEHLDHMVKQGALTEEKLPDGTHWYRTKWRSDSIERPLHESIAEGLFGRGRKVVGGEFDSKHPRGRGGEFAQVANLSHGQSMKVNGKEIKKSFGGFYLDGEPMESAEMAYRMATQASRPPKLANTGGRRRPGMGPGQAAMRIQEAKDSMAKASTPEPFSASKTSNWVAKLGGLPPYIQHIAHDIHDKRGKTVSEAIRIAIGVVKNWAHGHGKVDPGTKAAAAKALGEWTALKAKNAAKKVAGKLSEAEYDALLMLDGPAVVLEEAEERELVESLLEEGLFDSVKHPRARGGKFSKKLRRDAKGNEVWDIHAPNGERVQSGIASDGDVDKNLAELNATPEADRPKVIARLKKLEEAAKTDTLENKGEGIEEPVKEPERGPEDAKGGDTGPKQQIESTGDRVKHLQHRLATLGYEPGMMDGRFGPKTASAVREFQSHSMVAVDGVVGPTTTAALRTAPHPDEMRAAEGEGIEQPPVTGMPETPTEPAGEALKPDGSEIAKPPEEPKTPQESPKPKTPSSTMYKGVGVGQKSGDKTVRALQAELGHHGYTVATDGVFGPETHKTVKKFQRKWGLNPDGIVGPKTKQALAHVAKRRKSLAEAVEARHAATSGREQARALARERVLRGRLQEGLNVAALVADALDKNPEFTAALAERLKDDDAVALLEGLAKRGESAVEVHRMPNGMFAPKGSGQVLNPGAKVLVPHKAGKAEPVTGVVGKAAAAIKLTSGPDEGKSVAIHPDYAGGKVPATDLKVGDHFEHAGEHHAVIGKDEDGYVEAQSQVGDDESVKKFGGGQSVKPIAKPDYSKKASFKDPGGGGGGGVAGAYAESYSKATKINQQEKAGAQAGKPDAGGDLGPKFLKSLHALQPGQSVNQGGYKIEWLPPLQANPNAIGDINPGAMGSPGIFKLTDSKGEVQTRHEPEDVAAFLGGTEAPPPGVKGKGPLGLSGPDAASEPGGMGPNKSNHSLKDMPLGTTFEMNNGSQWKLHKPVNDPFMIIKPLDGGKAKPMHKMMAPPKVGPVAPGYESGVPSPPPMTMAPGMPPAPGVPGAPPTPGAVPGAAPGVPGAPGAGAPAAAPGTGGAGDDLFGKLSASVDMAKAAQAQGGSPAAAFKGMSAQQQVQTVVKTPESAALEAYKAAGGNDPAVIAALSKQLQECLDATVMDLQEDWAEWNRKRKLGLVGLGRTMRHVFQMQDPGDNAGGADPAVGFRPALRKLKDGGTMRVPLPEGELTVAHTAGHGALRQYHVTGGGAHVDPGLRRGPRNAVGTPMAAREAAERVMHTVHADFAHTAHHTGRVLAAKPSTPTRVQAVTGEAGTVTRTKDGFKVVHDAMPEGESETHRTADGAVRALKKGLRAKGARFLDEGHDTDPLSTMGASRIEKNALQRVLRDPDRAEVLKKRVEQMNLDGVAGDVAPDLVLGAMKKGSLTAGAGDLINKLVGEGGDKAAEALAPHVHHVVHVHHALALVQARVERETEVVRRLEESGSTRDLVRARARLRVLRARAAA